MLSERSKELLTHFCRVYLPARGAFEFAQEEGPVKMLGVEFEQINRRKGRGWLVDDVRANQAEAEQFVGGLLGMM